MATPERIPTAYASALQDPLIQAAERVVPGKGQEIGVTLLPLVEAYVANVIGLSEELRRMADLSSRASWQIARGWAEDWDELERRLRRAKQNLEELTDDNNMERLRDKCQGVKLALGYMEEAGRQRDQRMISSGEDDE